MVRAAIVGLGRWGRSLVASVQGKSDDIRFVAAHTCTRATAEGFCRDQGIPLVDSYVQILADVGEQHATGDVADGNEAMLDAVVAEVPLTRFGVHARVLDEEDVPGIEGQQRDLAARPQHLDGGEGGVGASREKHRGLIVSVGRPAMRFHDS